jgi:hypothetical protein
MSPQSCLFVSGIITEAGNFDFCGRNNAIYTQCIMAENLKFNLNITFPERASDVNDQKNISKKPNFVLEIPQEILLNWHDLKAKGQAHSYVNLIQKSQELPFQILQNCTLEKRINDAACLALRDCRGKTGRKKTKLLKKIRKIIVRDEDICTNTEFKVKDTKLIDEVDKLEATCSKLYSELREAEENRKVVEDKLGMCVVQNNLLEEKNSTLSNQVGNLENINAHNACQNCAGNLQNTYSKIDQVGTRQRLRKTHELKTKAERALWFLDSYGVTLSTICVEDSNGKQVDISPGINRAQKVSKYENLPEVEKTRIKEVLHILDRFCVGDAAYHALCEDENGLPRSYMVKQCRADINSTFTITRTPGDLVGAQMSFKGELKRKIKGKVGIFK